jgi:hypothetical protein
MRKVKELENLQKRIKKLGIDMIGDLYLLIKRFFHQHFFCIHEYKRFHCGPDYCYVECVKCGKLTDNFDLIND